MQNLTEILFHFISLQASHYHAQNVTINAYLSRVEESLSVELSPMSVLGEPSSGKRGEFLEEGFFLSHHMTETHDGPMLQYGERKEKKCILLE